MRNFATIFKLQLRNMFKRDKSRQGSKKWIGLLALFVILYGIIGFGLVFAVYELSYNMLMYGLTSEFIALLLTSALFFVLVFGIVTMLVCLYFSKDTEFFLALPIKPGTVFAAKIAVVYLTELVMAAALLLPCLITAGVIMMLPPVFYVIMPFAILLIPAIPLFFASIIAIPIMYLVSFFRNRGALGSIFVLIVFAGFFTGYYVLITRMQNVDVENVDITDIRRILLPVLNVLYPVYALAKAMTGVPVFGLNIGVSVLINVLIFLGCVVAFGVIAMIISSAVYRRGAASQLEGAKKKNNAVVMYRGSGTVSALMKKEWREIIRTPAFAMNCLLALILCPIVIGFVGFSFNSAEILKGAGGTGELSEIIELQMMIFAVIIKYLLFGFIMFLGIGANIGPATAFSREGEKMYFAKIMPVDYSAQIKAKSYIYIIIGSLTSVIGAVTSAIVQFDAVMFVCSLVFLLIFNYAAVNFGLLLDLKRPKLKWVTPNEAMKHNRNAVIYTLLVMLAGILFAVVGGFTNFLFSIRFGAVGVFLSWLIMFVAVLTLAVLSTALLYKDCNKKFESLDI